MDERELNVATGEYKLGRSPQKLVSRGIGSCVVICLYHRSKQAGAMIHAMLPEREKSTQDKSRFVDTGLLEVVSKLNKLGMPNQELEAKIIGGAHMFRALSSNGRKNLGDRNVEMAEKILKLLGVKIESEDVGGSVGRTTEFDLKTGIVKVTTKM